jgi:hypothetical protein
MPGGAPDPQRYRAHAHPKLCGYRVHAPARVDRPHHRAAHLFDTEFLAMTKPSKKPKPYIKCSAIAETSLYGDR